jgi:hypothetical protein
MCFNLPGCPDSIGALLPPLVPTRPYVYMLCGSSDHGHGPCTHTSGNGEWLTPYQKAAVPQPRPPWAVPIARLFQRSAPTSRTAARLGKRATAGSVATSAAPTAAARARRRVLAAVVCPVDVQSFTSRAELGRSLKHRSRAVLHWRAQPEATERTADLHLPLPQVRKVRQQQMCCAISAKSLPGPLDDRGNFIRRLARLSLTSRL